MGARCVNNSMFRETVRRHAAVYEALLQPFQSAARGLSVRVSEAIIWLSTAFVYTCISRPHYRTNSEVKHMGVSYPPPPPHSPCRVLNI